MRLDGSAKLTPPARSPVPGYARAMCPNRQPLVAIGRRVLRATAASALTSVMCPYWIVTCLARCLMGLLNPVDGVRVDSVANLDNLQLLARSRLVRRVSRARTVTMSAICAALAMAVDCDR